MASSWLSATRAATSDALFEYKRVMFSSQRRTDFEARSGLAFFAARSATKTRRHKGAPRYPPSCFFVLLRVLVSWWQKLTVDRHSIKVTLTR